MGDGQQSAGNLQGGIANLTNAGKGRVTGVPNKKTVVMKEAIMSVYHALQAGEKKPHGHFLNWAESEPTEFYKLAAKLIPLQISGDDGGPIRIVVEYRD